MGEGIPLHGDRSAWDTLLYAIRHAKDIEDEAYLVHTPPPTGVADGHVLTADGAGGMDWEAPSGGSGGTGTDSDAIHDNVAGEIHAITEKTSPDDDDEFIIEDSAASYAKKRVKLSNLPSSSGSGTTAASDIILSDVYASRPAASDEGRLFLASDSLLLERDTGAAWAPWGPIFKFTEPISGDFSWINQGSATIDTSQGGIYLYAPANSGDSLRVRKKSAPSTPYTIDIGFITQALRSNFFAAGFVWRQSSDGKLISAQLEIDATVQTSIGVLKWNSATSYSANYVNPNLERPCGGPMWIRCTDNGTNRLVSISYDGIHWLQVHTIGRTDFLTADEVGFFVNVNNATYSHSMWLLHWAES